MNNALLFGDYVSSAVIVFRGFGVNGYRSFGGKSLQRVATLDKVTLLAGQNNSGKSNALRAFSEILPKIVSRQPLTSVFADPRATPKGWAATNTVKVAIGLDLNIVISALERAQSITRMLAVRELLSSEAFSAGYDNVVWFEADIAENGRLDYSLDAFNSLPALHSASAYEIQTVLAVFGGRATGRPSADFAGFIEAIDPTQFVPPIEAIAAARQLTAQSEAGPYPLDVQLRNGSGLIQGLARLQNPDDSDRELDEPKFEGIQRFVRDVLEDSTAALQVNFGASELSVRIRGSYTPLRALGSGIEQLILIAAAATITNDSLITIEEPELFLHPSLQRKLVDYLARETTNRYLMSTHSAHILNAELAAISHVRVIDGFTEIIPAELPPQIATLVAELGYRASDLVQSNFVVWVEGPSDRTYLRKWLKETTPQLDEGAHFTIMFYGGALLNHLTAEDAEVTEFINLHRINRNMAIVIDSDAGPGKRPLDINPTKQRVAGEMSDSDQMAWITQGYTIENYVSPELLQSAMQSLYPGREIPVSADVRVSPVKYIESSLPGLRISKTLLAAKVVELADGVGEPWALDVAGKIEELARRIATANSLKI